MSIGDTTNGGHSSRKGRTKVARTQRRAAPKTSKKSPSKSRKPQGPVITKARAQMAVVGSFGIKQTIADRLGVSRGTVNEMLNRKGWEDIRAIYDEEVNGIADVAEVAILDTLVQRLDLRAASQTAQWYLGKMVPERFADRRTLIHEGGENPIKTETSGIDLARLPLDLRRQILEAMEAEEGSQ